MNENRRNMNFNKGWYFHKNEETGVSFSSYESLNFSSEIWESVTIPHTPHIEQLEITKMWRGICWYYKKFELDKRYSGKKVFIQFEGAMTIADVWINGRHMIRTTEAICLSVIDRK